MKKKNLLLGVFKNIHGITLLQFYALSRDEQRAAELDYKTRYGSPIIYD